MKFEFPVASPASAGIPAAAIERFMTRLENKRLPMHSVLMLRHGTLLFESYRRPFDRDRKHRLYSTSKSFVSVAIGILAGDGLLSLDDPVTKFFPDKVPADLHPYTAAATIRDLLRMATPHYYGACTYSPAAPDWADTYFQAKPTHLPGKIFSYDTTATTMLSIIVERVSGKEFTDFLRDRLFIPAGMSEDITCIETPCGHEWGGSGVLATPRDLMKFAYTCMNGGRIHGQQLIPEDYIRAATSRQIDNTLTAGDAEHSFGYGYQFWRTRHNGFACRGMGSQLAVCLPDQDFILVTTGDTQSYPAACGIIYEALWREIYPYLTSDAPVEDDEAANEALKAKWDGREILCIAGAPSSPKEAEINGRTFVFTEANQPGFRKARFTFGDGEGTIEYENATGAHTLRFGFGHQVRQRFPETHYFGKRIGTPSGEGYDCVVSAAWVSEDTLYIQCFSIDDHIGTCKMSFAFNDGCCTLFFGKNAEWFFDEYQGFGTGRAAD